MRTPICTLVVAALMSGPAARAADIPTPGQAARTVAKRLSVEDLGTMLENLGCELVPVKNDKGELYGYDTKDTTEGWTVNARVELSPNGKFLWFTGVVAKVENVNDVPKDALIAMLVESQKSGPAHVHYSTAYKNFMLALAVPNANVAPADMRAAMTLYTDSLKQAIKSWDKAVKPVSASTATAND